MHFDRVDPGFRGPGAGMKKGCSIMIVATRVTSEDDCRIPRDAVVLAPGPLRVDPRAVEETLKLVRELAAQMPPPPPER